jgi:hypothetical protein
MSLNRIARGHVSTEGLAMPTIAKREATRELVQAVQSMSADDLLDFHNELFPEKPESTLDSIQGVEAVRKKATDYLGQRLEVEEILDLWNVAFPEAWNVYYDDETDMIHFSKQPESVHQAD